MKLLRLALLAVIAALLASCATPPKRAPLPDDVAADLQQRREAALAPDRDWALQGRVAVSGGREGGSARIEWRQQGRDFDVWLRAPVTRQSWRLQRQDAQVRLEGLAGGPRLGADAEALLFQATGWTIPMDAMANWVRGACRSRAVTGCATAPTAVCSGSSRMAGPSATNSGRRAMRCRPCRCGCPPNAGHRG